MKKILKKIKVISLIICALFLTTFIYADEDNGRSYSIEEFNTDLYIYENGDVTYINEIKYNFSGDYNGIFRIVNYNKNSKYKGIFPNSNIYNAESIYDDVVIKTIDSEGNITFYTETNTGEEGTYEVIQEGKAKVFKVYMPVSNDTATVYHKYTLKNAMVTHKDVSELYTGLFEDDSKVEKATLKIHYPKEINTDEKVEVFCHTKSDYIASRDKNSYTINVNEIKEGKKFDIRLLMDNSLVTSGKTTDLVAKPEIYKIEEYLENEPFTYEINGKNMMVFLVLAIINFIYSLIKYFKVFNKYEKEKKPVVESIPSMHIPNEERNPIEINMIENCGNGGVDTQVILATLFDLVNKKYIKLTPNKILNKKGKEETDYTLELVKEYDGKYKYVKKIVDLFFKKSKKINLKDRLEKMGESESDYLEIISIWEDANKDYLENCENIIKPKEVKDKKGIKIFKLIIFIAATILMFLSPINTLKLYTHDYVGLFLSGMLVVLISGILSFISGMLQAGICKMHAANEKGIIYIGLTLLNASVFSILTYILCMQDTEAVALGYYGISIILTIISFAMITCLATTNQQKDEIVEERAMWMGLKKYINDYSYLNDKNLSHIITWEEYLVYGMTFGLTKKIKKEVDIKCKQDGNSDFMAYYYMDCNARMFTSITSSQDHYTSSNSCGGYSGGGGGGCGGGGGAF